MSSIWEKLGFGKRTREVKLRDPKLMKNENLVGSEFEDAVARELAEQRTLDEKAAATRLQNEVVAKPVEAVDTEIRPAKKPAGPIRAFQRPVGMSVEDFVRYSQNDRMTQSILEKIAKDRK